MSSNGLVQPKPQAIIQQPKPQVIPGASVASILVSSRQKGNPILNHIRNQPWEYADIPADYVLGATTCALFLSLKYHKLHPEYIYTRIRNLAGKYNLRIILTMVDIEAHEESLKELSKASLVNNVTVILAWSAAEAGRYIELFKTYEHAAPTVIKGHQSTNFSDRLVEFVTVPRSVNKTDALGLVSNFGTIRTSINAQPEEISLIAGWGEKKVQRWCKAVREPFRSEKASKKILSLETMESSVGGGDTPRVNSHRPPALSAQRTASSSTVPLRRAVSSVEEESLFVQDDRPNVPSPDPPVRETPLVATRKRPAEDEVDDGVMAALAKLRK